MIVLSVSSLPVFQVNDISLALQHSKSILEFRGSKEDCGAVSSPAVDAMDGDLNGITLEVQIYASKSIQGHLAPYTLLGRHAYETLLVPLTCSSAANLAWRQTSCSCLTRTPHVVYGRSLRNTRPRVGLRSCTLLTGFQRLRSTQIQMDTADWMHT